ncbi:ATP-grasp domain-containing protein [Amycolatopsis sp. 195334CR]|nr:ATP-grasp domain-containing protein [Amycolatopsis sp. 195334CR]
MSLLVVHVANVARRRHFARLRAHCPRLLLLMREPSWEAEFADRVVDADTTDLAATVAAARALAEREPVHGVLAFVEHAVPLAAAVAAELGLPFVSPETAYLARDKHAMRQAFAEAGLAQPGFGVARTVAEALAAADRIGYPLVLKPILGGGSKYVVRVDDPGQLAERFEATRRGAWDGFADDALREVALERHGEGLLLEGFLPGAEVSVESLVDGGRTEVVAVHDKPLPMNGPYFEELSYTTPSRLSSPVLDRIAEVTAAAHDALGITLGGTHTELRIDGGEPKILETAARVGGGGVYRSVLLSTGVDLIAAAADLALGRSPQVRAEAARPVGTYTFFAEKAGEVVAVKGLPDPAVSEYEVYVEPGDVVDVPPHVSKSHGCALFTADTVSGLDEVQRRLTRTIRIETR